MVIWRVRDYFCFFFGFERESQTQIKRGDFVYTYQWNVGVMEEGNLESDGGEEEEREIDIKTDMGTILTDGLILDGQIGRFLKTLPWLPNTSPYHHHIYGPNLIFRPL